MVPAYLSERATGGAVKSSHIGEDLDGVDASFSSFLCAEEKDNQRAKSQACLSFSESRGVSRESQKDKLGFKGVSPLERLMPVGIVESERSAVILSEARPELLWMAYAYPLNLTVDLFEPLQGHTITLFPRTDPNQDNYYAALEFADQVHRRYHLDFRVSSLLEDNATPAQKSAEIDLADFLFT